jgi:anti-anti-sigma factor
MPGTERQAVRMEDLQIEVSFEGLTAIIKMTGEAHNNSASEFCQVLKETAARTKWIVIDMTELDYICSASMGCLMASVNHVFKLGGKIFPIGVTDNVRRVFEVIKFSQIIEITHSPYHTIDDALKILKEMQDKE